MTSVATSSVHGATSTAGDESVSGATVIVRRAKCSPPLPIGTSVIGANAGSRVSSAGPAVTVHVPEPTNTAPLVVIGPLQSAGVVPSRLPATMLFATVTAPGPPAVLTARPADGPPSSIVLPVIVVCDTRTFTSVPAPPRTSSAAPARSSLARMLVLTSRRPFDEPDGAT